MTERDIDRQKYEAFMRAMAKLSHCFSDGDIPYIQYRFAENVFAYTVKGGVNISRSDNSFDVMIHKGDIKYGVGVKTFVGPANYSPTGNHIKTEKVAEFTKDSQLLNFGSLPYDQLIYQVINLRNKRVKSDTVALGLSLSHSYYHCLVRLPFKLYIHEEPYALIETNHIQPCDSAGNIIDNFSINTRKSSMIYFKDGVNTYAYNRSKNTLYKIFDLKDLATKDPITIDHYFDPFQILPLIDQLTNGTGQAPAGGAVDSANKLNFEIDTQDSDQTDIKYVILPLYSYRAYRQGRYELFEKSGLNQWNANGRPRKFGEAYIPIPQVIHHYLPDFFPGRDKRMKLALPNDEVVIAKVCQENDKALMSQQNDELMKWLFATIDGGLELAQKRLDPSDTSKNKPYTYDNLLEIGQDAVAVFKYKDGTYGLRLMPTGSFECFEKHFLNDHPTRISFAALLEEVQGPTAMES